MVAKTSIRVLFFREIRKIHRCRVKIGEAITAGERIIDFLPPPDQLVKKPPKDNDILDQYVRRFRNKQNS